MSVGHYKRRLEEAKRASLSDRRIAVVTEVLRTWENCALNELAAVEVLAALDAAEGSFY